MKRSLTYSLLCTLVVLFFFSCQKEVSLENELPAKGTLQSETTGECLNKVVAGTYIANKALGDTNYIEVELNITNVGAYSISTDAVNGYSFKASGSFATTGTNRVRLIGSGKPVAAGVNTFMVNFDGTQCQVAVTVLPEGSTGSPAAFTLDGSGGQCLNHQVSGSYVKSVALTSANKVDIKVMVSAVGTYTVTTNTVNGYSFSGSGALAATGAQTITLTATGTPTADGVNTFTVTVGGQTCSFPVTVTASAPPPPGPCGATAQGTYTSGTALTAANTITVQHTYAAAGTYTVTTNTVNGYSFTTGPVNVTNPATPATIVLTGSGTPTAAGTDNFSINFGDNTSCTFSVTVTQGTTPPPAANHFPLALNNWWSYNDFFAPTDSVKRTATASGAISGNTYFKVDETAQDGSPNASYYFRKAGNDYLEYNYVDWYTSFYFDVDTYGDINFLKEGMTTGQSYNTQEWVGDTSGVRIRLRYAITCTEGNASVTVNGKNFTGVYKVTMQAQIAQGATGGTWNNDSIRWEMWYANNIGLIYTKASVTGGPSFEQNIRHWKLF